jgi:DNA-binding transcriptional MerR regulator
MSQADFERYLEKGADGLPLDEVRRVLRWQDEHPAEALAAQRRHEQARRDEDDRSGALAAWKASGRDEREFGPEFDRLKRERDSVALRAMTDGARDASQRAFWRNF